MAASTGPIKKIRGCEKSYYTPYFFIFSICLYLWVAKDEKVPFIHYYCRRDMYEILRMKVIAVK